MKHLIFLIICFCISYNSFTQNYTKVSNIKELEVRLTDNSKSLTTIVADFTQEKHLAFLDEKIISTGKFWLREANSIRWEYNNPFSHIIIIHDGKFRTRDGKGKTSSFDINSNPVFKEVNNLIVSSARGDLIADNKFDVEAFENQTSYKLILTPKDEKIKQVINKTELYFDKELLSVYKVVMIEGETDFTIITFTNRVFNANIPNSIFNID
ncbi:MAG: outer membrane lipoprotein carrier protein LolA [Bacteroidetes bacterium]|nr:outer membrane lipoprotein carrier protein LolA [Bacteroidota bacterium]